MVFQFIEDLNSLVRELVKSLDDNGILFFAVHDAEYVYECTKLGVKFREPEKKTCMNEREILIDTTWIKTYPRTSRSYDKVLLSNGLTYLGHTLAGNKPPIELKEGEIWNKSKYYVSWYKKDRKQQEKIR